MTPDNVGVVQDLAGDGQAFRPPRFRQKLKELGYDLARTLEDAFERFKDLADKKKHVYDEDIEALVDDEICSMADRFKVVSLTVIAGDAWAAIGHRRSLWRAQLHRGRRAAMGRWTRSSRRSTHRAA
jgi:2-isopropylmalate synthase